ncbi:MAG: hypothetical protein AB2708_18580 [Candidatus Thiodiazotropha taylori]
MRMRSFIFTITFTLLCSTPMLAETKILPPPDLSEAQKLIFFKDHLQGVSKGSQINYQFTSKTDKEGFQDEIVVRVTNIVSKGKRDLEFDFLSGENHIDFSSAMSYTGNPVIIHFLERDISLMSKDTGGWNGYFRNKIRNSFRKPAHMDEVTFEFEGKKVKGTEIVITPFLGDPNARNFKLYANKRYEFLFSDKIPGGIYRIRTQVPSENGKQPLIDEDMKFKQIIPGA